MRISAFDLFCEENYVPAWREAKQDEEARRAEAFLDVGRPVAGIPLRPLTPQDVLVLDGFGSPFVRGQTVDATPEHIIAVLWLLRARVPSGLLGRLFGWRLHRATLLRRWRSEEQRLRDHAELNLWFEAAFADNDCPREASTSTPRQSAQPIGVHFLAGLLGGVCADLGAIDPATGRPLIESPLARLFQYQKILRVRREGERFVDFSGADRIKAQALRHWNNLLTPAERADWQNRADALAAEIAVQPPATS
jgi:hypothetical protein